MKKTYIPILLLLVSLCTAGAVWSQNSPNCSTYTDDDFLTGQVFFNYGGVTSSFNQEQLRMNSTAGQLLIGSAINQEYTMSAGFWSTLLLPPAAPVIKASEGDLDDRIQVEWEPDPLSPSASSYKLYRNGALLVTVDGETTSFIDFNVLAGRFYTYEVAGVNVFGEGPRGGSLGFLNPNGSITGQVKTFSGNPVPGAVVTLSPTFGAALEFDGEGMAFAEYQPHFPREEFTVSCWVKLGDGNDNAPIFDFGSDQSKNWWLHTLPASSGKGVRFGVGNGPGSVTELDCQFPSATADDWHYVAVSYNGSSILLYVDGELIETAVTGIQPANSTLFLGRNPQGTKFYAGKLDELRFFNRQLPQTEIQMVMNQTVSATTPGLVAYWKFDEGVGSKVFNISENKTKLYLCGASWTSDKPPVANAGITDETGFYKIEGVNYGAGGTFTAKVSKNFYFNQSLEFNAVNEHYASLTEFGLPDSATVTLTVKPFDFSGQQTLLSKADAGGTNQFSLDLNAGNLELTIGNTTESFGSLGMGFHYIALVMRKDGSSLYVTCYVDGSAVSTKTFNATDWAGLPWKLGARAQGASGHQRYFTGLIDEAAFFGELLSLPAIQTYNNIGTSVTNPNLRSYFNLNEGSDEVLHDMGTELTGEGSIHGAQWSTVAAITDILPHLFTPSSRLVSLNPSNTSTDEVDFTDQSTIPVTGYVRFENTNCFQKKVEILVNGKSNVPQIFTDEDGKFSADFEPGKNVVLTPKFEEHTYYPAFWELPNISSPVAGILFRNQVKRKVFGQMAGGYCRKSVVPDGSIVKVKVATLNGCYEQIKQLPGNGKFVFDGVPPDSVTVAVIEHSNPVIYNYFQNLGGATVDLKMKNDTTDFIYFAPPNVEISPLPTNECGEPMMSMLQQGKVTIKVYEEYDGGVCYVDTAKLTINNDIAHLSQFDTMMTEGSLVHKFRVEEPNIAAPYKKFLQVTAEAHDEQATETLEAVVLGRRPRQTTFTSTSPDIPMLILHDPPGDGSSAFMESGETTCQNWSFSASHSQDLSSNITIHAGPEIETSMGTPFFATSLKVNVTADLGFNIESSTTAYSSTEMETCITTTKNISTGGGDVIVGSDQGGDVYMGGAMNFLYGITDELLYDSNTCEFYLDKGLFVFPEGFATTFIYSEYQILNSVIPSLQLIGDNASAARWQEIVERNRKNRKEAVFSRNISFDSNVIYSESETTEVSQSNSTSWTQNFSAGFATEFGVRVNGFGVSGGVAMNFGTEKSKSVGNSAAQSRTVGFTLADDDIGDNFTVNIKKDRVYGTPVFDLVSGQSSCPHEPNTQPRDGLDLTVDKQVAVNVPMNDAAVFKFNLGNTSQSEDWRYYTLALYNATNPDGAVVKIQGSNSQSGTFLVGPNQSQEVIVTVERGPNAFVYENLAMYAIADCEGVRYDALNNGDWPPEPFFEQIDLDVYFLEPCSPIDIGFPLQNWVMTPADGNV
ncbi:MAG: LamG-like jellyroll fold domain-containing protein, partial [Bacteroidota bacterium]